MPPWYRSEEARGTHFGEHDALASAEESGNTSL